MKTTLITGASGGIGEALAKRLAERKHHLFLVARNGEKLEKLCKELQSSHGISARFLAVDLSRAGAAELVYNETVKLHLDVNCLINNAGIGAGGEFETLPVTSDLDMMYLNMSSLVALTHCFLPGMRKQKNGHILNVASIAAFMPIPYMAVYSASKAFVCSFSQALSEECKPYNVRVMLLCPGLTTSNFMEAAGINNAKGEALLGMAPTQTPDEVAQEAVKALEAGKQLMVPGAFNRFGVRMLALIPNWFIARFVARSYQKKMKLG